MYKINIWKLNIVLNGMNELAHSEINIKYEIQNKNK